MSCWSEELKGGKPFAIEEWQGENPSAAAEWKDLKLSVNMFVQTLKSSFQYAQ